MSLCWHLANSMHYDDAIMTTIASQITSLTSVYSTVYSDAHQRKHQSSASLAFVWGIHRDRWIPRTKGQLRGKCFNLMTSSWINHVSVTKSWRTRVDRLARNDNHNTIKRILYGSAKSRFAASQWETALLSYAIFMYEMPVGAALDVSGSPIGF